MAPPHRGDSFRRVRKADGGGGGGGGDGSGMSCIRLSFKAVYCLSALLSVIYGVCAFQYGVFNVLGPEGPFRGTPHAIATNWSRWNDAVFAPAVPTGLEYFEGEGSTTAAQTVRYGRGWYFMSPHQIGGGIMILCSIILMNPRSRVGKMAKWHRTAGGIYTVAHTFNLCGSLGFLLRHGLPPVRHRRHHPALTQ
jgi:hypothetical protein